MEMTYKGRYEGYASAIVHDLLELRLGDALSINTEERDFEFARLVANTALEVTNVTVKIVVTVNGRPENVVEFDPPPVATDPRAFVMLRLSHESKPVAAGPSMLDIIPDPDDLGSMQRLGHLAEPVLLNRRIAVPWCVARLYDDDDERWERIDRCVSLGVPAQSLAAVYRRENLCSLCIRELHLEGPDCDLTVRIPLESVFTGARQVLGNGRTFLNGIDFDRLSCIADRNGTNGHFKAKVTVLGRKRDAEFVFKDGLLVDWTHCVELDRLFEMDDALRRAGYLSMRDNEVLLHLGGSLVEALADAPEKEDELPDFFNCSLYTLCCDLGKDLQISATDASGLTKVLARDGFFIE